MTGELFRDVASDGLLDLERDLTLVSGPRISTIKNHNFAILLYGPEKEFRLRAGLRGMIQRLVADGWGVLDMDLQRVLFERLRIKVGTETLDSWIAHEKRVHEKSPERALQFLRDKLQPHVDGAAGLAKDVEERIQRHLKAHGADPTRTLVLLGNVGSLYPFFRSSALLKHLGGRTSNVPVVLLYPGKREDGGLSFMQELTADRDYRPRVYDWGSP